MRVFRSFCNSLKSDKCSIRRTIAIFWIASSISRYYALKRFTEIMFLPLNSMPSSYSFNSSKDKLLFFMFNKKLNVEGANVSLSLFIIFLSTSIKNIAK